MLQLRLLGNTYFLVEHNEKHVKGDWFARRQYLLPFIVSIY